MKRQHPTEPSLFWCPQCQTYKARGEFGVDNTKKMQLPSACKQCRNMIRNQWRIENPEKNREEYRKYQRDPDKRRLRDKIWRIANLERHRKSVNARSRKAVEEINNSYAIKRLHSCGINPSPETIEIKRQGIIMHRTLNQFKKWRKENESNSEHVYGEQRADEADHERRIQCAAD